MGGLMEQRPVPVEDLQVNLPVVLQDKVEPRPGFARNGACSRQQLGQAVDATGHRTMSLLTSDNPHLSRPTIERDLVEFGPPEGAWIEPARTVQDYLRAGISENTRRAYRADLRHFIDWGGTIPAREVVVAQYLTAHAGALAVSTLTRRLAAISKAHSAQGLPSPATSDLVRTIMRGVRRTHGKPQRQVAAAVKEDVLAMVAGLGDGLKDLRDRALILIGFAGAFRRSELVAINCADVEQVTQGIVVTVRRGKTDQEGRGRKIGIPYARGAVCPVEALDAWLTATGIAEGHVFRPVSRHGHVAGRPLSAEAVALVVKARAAAVGLDPTKYAGHSLRAGLATSAAAAGVSSWKIRAQTGHASDAMLRRYIRDGEIFVDNAAGAVL